MFIYFVSFGCLRGGICRIYNTEIAREKAITDIVHIREIEEKLEEDDSRFGIGEPVRTVMIISYQLLRTEPMGSTATAGQLSQEES